MSGKSAHWRVGDEMWINVLDSRRFAFDKLSARVERWSLAGPFRSM
jgi:hypothetical protein